MSKAIIIAMISLMAIICLTLLCGCVLESPAVNNSTSAGAFATIAQRQNVFSSGMVQASGGVSLEGKAVTGASVLAISFDGKDSVLTVTDDQGKYVLNLKPGLWYNITASYKGLKHTIWPVYLPDRQNGVYDISLYRVPRSTLVGSAAAGSQWKGHAVYIEATKLDGGVPVMAITGDDGSYSLDVAPGNYYVTGNTYLYASIKKPANFCFHNAAYSYTIKVNSNETVLLDYNAEMPEGLEPTLLSFTPTPSRMLPVFANASGHVYFEGMPVGNACVEVVSIDYGHKETTVTDENGSFMLSVEPAVPYNLTAYYQGAQHTIRSISKGSNYNFNLSAKPYSSIAWGGDWGSPSPWWDIYIEAKPADGGVPATSLTHNGSYSLDLNPGLDYRLTGICYNPYGEEYRVYLGQDTVNLGPNETLIIGYDVQTYHPPMSFGLSSISFDGITTYHVPSKPVPVNGHVYLDGKPIAGATIKAVSIFGDYNSTVVTNESGYYEVGLKPRALHEITATYQGLRHSVLPAFRWELNNTGPYQFNNEFINNYPFDINLTTTPKSTIRGTWTGDSAWNSSSWQIKASPRIGGTAVIAPIACDGSFTVELQPFTYYNLSITNKTDNETEQNIQFNYHTGIRRSSYLLFLNETILVEYNKLW